jgi:acyl dehydratase
VAEFELPVEAGLVALFARAIGDPNPRYRSGSPEADAAGGAVAPPTFAMVADAFDPDFRRRPPLDAAVADEGPATQEALLHVSQHFTYARPVRVGEVLTVRRRPERTWTKQGRTGGQLEFIEAVTELVAADGTIVVSSAWTDVRPERGHRQMSVEQPAAAPSSAPGAGMVVAHDLSPTRIAMYVGVAGDFHPLHHDDVYARVHGYPSVFVPGMLTMALTGRAVTDVVGPANLRSFGGRLTGQVWPGATLRTAVVPGGSGDHGLARYVVTATDQDGRTVFAGTVEATQDGDR